MNERNILVTGGKGLLASELQKLLPKARFEGHEALDVTDPEAIGNYLDKNGIELIIHTAAFMPPAKSKEDPASAINVNIIGTAYLARECIKRDIRLFYISTDYVFKGDKGYYKEDDPLLPVNEYAWSKLGGECTVRLHPRGLIIRTTFGPKLFPYPKAFVDQWTSKETVDLVAKKIARLIGTNATGVIHLGGKRKTVYDYATSLPNGMEVGRLKRAELAIDYKVPKDTSLNTSKYGSLVR